MKKCRLLEISSLPVVPSIAYSAVWAEQQCYTCHAVETNSVDHFFCFWYVALKAYSHGKAKSSLLYHCKCRCFTLFLLISSVDTPVPNATWKMVVTAGRRWIGIWSCPVCMSGIFHGTSHTAFKQRYQWAPSWVGKLFVISGYLDICRVYRCVDTISVTYCLNPLCPSDKMFLSLIYFSSCTETEQTNPMYCSGLKHDFSFVPVASD